jgi:bacteriorhodopsin
MPETPLFLKRRSYRRRRLMDAVRMLPLLCMLLWLVVPTMWPNSAAGQGAQTPLSTAIWYLFLIWMLAIAASFALWRRVRRHDDTTGVSATEARDS